MRYRALQEEWKTAPPLRQVAASYFKIRKPHSRKRRKRSGDDQTQPTKSPDVGNLADLVAMFPGGVISV